MNQRKKIMEIEHRIRNSLIYHQWIKKNLSPVCLVCDSTENLQVHHLIDLYHIILGLWKLYGDMEAVITHALEMHEENKCETVTLCDKCHSNMHPARNIVKGNEKIRIENWTVIPRILPAPFQHGSKSINDNGLPLLPIQLLAGIGMLLLMGQMENDTITFKRVQMAHILGKAPGTSFNNAIERSLECFINLGIIAKWEIEGPEASITISPQYIQTISKSPWFMSMDDVRTNKMPVFALRWMLNCQSCRRTFKIGIQKLTTNLGIKTTTPKFVEKCIEKAMKEIQWASYELNGKIFTFKIGKRGATPIWSLRNALYDEIDQYS